MIEAAERDGSLQPGGTIIEPTSGNTGIGLAIVAAIKGYRLVLTMPEDMSVERRALLDLFGVEFVLTPAVEAMNGAVMKAQQLAAEHGYFMPQQFVNHANPEAHRLGTGREIADALDGKIDALVVGIGTGGTLTGVAQALRQHNPKILVIGVEPARSAILSGKPPGWHRIQGIGAGFVPEVLDLDLVSEVIAVNDEDAFTMVRRLAELEGLLVGPSAGAAAQAAISVARRLGPEKTVVTIFPDTGERYLSLLAGSK
jgi:cysteine synthase A